MTLLQGKLPHAGLVNGEAEILLMADTAQAWGVKPGSEATFSFQFASKPQPASYGVVNGRPSLFITKQLNVRVAGIFDPGSDPFWHGQNFHPVDDSINTLYTVLIPNQTLLSLGDQLSKQYAIDAAFTMGSYYFTWYYYLDVTRLTINQLDDLATRLGNLVSDLNSEYGSVFQQIGSYRVKPPLYPYQGSVLLTGATLQTNVSDSILQQFTTHNVVSHIPVLFLSLQIVALMLLFVALMVDLLVERQSEAIAVLRSRGASGLQVFSALLLQCLILCVFAALLAPLLSVGLLSLFAPHLLNAHEQDAIDSILRYQAVVLNAIWWYVLATMGAALLAMALALGRVLHQDVLRLRRQAARGTHRPLWQRLYLDVLAGIIALLGYGFSLYVSGVAGPLDARSSTLASAPLTLITPLFLLIGGLLLFLRLFPLLIALGAWLALRGRGAPSVLALAQMARTPGRAVRMTMLLALPLAFSLFTLVFTATQAQHLNELASYEAGADFSGDLPAAVISQFQADVQARYRAIPGVLASSAGYVGKGVPVAGSRGAIQVMAVDSDSYGQVGVWSQQASNQSLPSLMRLLSRQRPLAEQKDVVPVIVDALVRERLGLHLSSTFTVDMSGFFNELMDTTLNCVVVGEVEHLPSINDSVSADISIPGGLLLDYQSYNAVYQHDTQLVLNEPTTLPVNHVWLRTGDDAQAVASVRTALKNSSLVLNNLYDRRLLLDNLRGDPLYLNLVSILTVGTTAALLLALLGDVLASWLGARLRLGHFVLLRALGTSPQQVRSVLSWEQGMIYVTALLLGLLFGALLISTLIPTLILNNLPTQGNLSRLSNNQFFALQHILPAHLVVPDTLIFTIVALVIICLVTLVMMVRMVSRPVLGQALRINQD